MRKTLKTILISLPIVFVLLLLSWSAQRYYHRTDGIWVPQNRVGTESVVLLNRRMFWSGADGEIAFSSDFRLKKEGRDSEYAGYYRVITTEVDDLAEESGDSLYFDPKNDRLILRAHTADGEVYEKLFNREREG